MFYKICALALLSFLFYQFCFKLWYKIYLYKKQGITLMPGCTRPIIGNLPELFQYRKIASKSKYPLQTPFVWMTQHFIEPENSSGIKFENHKAVVFNVWGNLIL